MCLKEAIDLVLLTKFGKKSKGVIKKINQIDNLKKLKILKKQVIKVKNLKELERKFDFTNTHSKKMKITH